jgi:hypothetical protein
MLQLEGGLCTRVGGKQYSFFRPTLIYRESEGYGSRPTFTPAVVLFVTLPETETTDPG